MKKQHLFLAALSVMMLCVVQSRAAYVLDIDTDGLDDGPVALNPNFSFGGDTTAASSSSASAAVGHNQADSLFGGNGDLLADTYQATYTPAVDGDNVNLELVALNDDGDYGGGAAGGSGEYDIYATWPISNNISGGLTNYRLNDGISDLFTVALDQNTVQGFVDPTNGQTFAGGEWIYLGTATLDANTTYTLIQEASANTFVSMRASAFLFDVNDPRVPEPSTILLGCLGGLGLLAGRRRR